VKSPLRPGGPLARTIHFRVYLLMALGVAFSIFAMALAGWLKVRSLDARLMDGRLRAAEAVADHLDEQLRLDLELLQHVPTHRGFDLEDRDAQPERDAMHEEYLHFRFPAMFLVGARGAVVLEEPGRSGAAPSTPASLAWAFQTLSETGRPQVSNLLPASGGLHLYEMVPVRNWQGRVVGAVGGRMDASMARALQVMKHLVPAGGGHADLVDGNGIIIASTQPSRARATVECRRHLSDLLAQKKPEVAACGACHHARFFGADQVRAFAPLAAAPWGVVVWQPRDAVVASGGEMPATFFGAALVVACFSALFAWGAARSVTEPLYVLTGEAERIATGDLDEPIPDLGTDEVGRLAAALDRMRRSLSGLIHEVGEANAVLEQRVEERTAELGRLNAQLREREASRRELLRKLISAQENERKRIARELHDDTTQSLAVLVMGLEAAAAAVRSGAGTPRFDEVKALAVRTLEDVHRIIRDLRPSVLDDLGLYSAVRWYAESTFTPRGVAVRCEISAPRRRLPPEVETALFRVCQEALNNVARHAQAEKVLVQLEQQGETLRIEIEDDGRGFDPAPSAASGGRPHFGLMGIRERVEILGGKLQVDSAPGQGTRLSIEVPLPPEVEA
jgi:signal transduction histidine kinase